MNLLDDFVTLFLADLQLVEQFSVKERRERSSKRRSVDRTLAIMGESSSPSSCITDYDDEDDTRKRQHFYNQTEAQHTHKPANAEPNNATKLNTNKPTPSQTTKSKTTANKNSSIVFPADLAKLEAAELKALEPEAATQGDDGDNDGRT